tara:strand:+ start:781 stop:1290 length:510 start_codon:yes stop_codon:yes gene_type:complete
MEKFSVYLDSGDALSGSTTPYRTVFNLGSVYNFAPQAEKYANEAYCYVKVSNFSIKYTATQANTDDISNILISINSSLPNSATNVDNSDGVALNQSGIIATIPMGASNYSYSNVDYDNEMIKCANIFKGNLQIELLDQYGGIMSSELGSSNPFTIMLCVYFEKKDSIEY